MAKTIIKHTNRKIYGDKFNKELCNINSNTLLEGDIIIFPTDLHNRVITEYAYRRGQLVLTDDGKPQEISYIEVDCIRKGEMQLVKFYPNYFYRNLEVVDKEFNFGYRTTSGEITQKFLSFDDINVGIVEIGKQGPFRVHLEYVKEYVSYNNFRRSPIYSFTKCSYEDLRNIDLSETKVFTHDKSSRIPKLIHPIYQKENSQQNIKSINIKQVFTPHYWHKFENVYINGHTLNEIFGGLRSISNIIRYNSCNQKISDFRKTYSDQREVESIERTINYDGNKIISDITKNTATTYVFSSVYSYNKYDLLETVKEIDSNGQLLKTFDFEYNNFGDNVTVITYDTSGHMYMKEKYSYISKNFKSKHKDIISQVSYVNEGVLSDYSKYEINNDKWKLVEQYEFKFDNIGLYEIIHLTWLPEKSCEYYYYSYNDNNEILKIERKRNDETTGHRFCITSLVDFIYGNNNLLTEIRERNLNEEKRTVYEYNHNNDIIKKIILSNNELVEQEEYIIEYW